MMKAIKILGAALLSFGLLSNSNAAILNIYSTDFSGSTFSQGPLPVINSATYQGNWFNPSADTAQWSTFIYNHNGTNSLIIGGHQIGAAGETPTSYLTYGIQGINVQNGNVGFNSIFQINPGTRTQDSFGWTLFNTAGEQLISVDLNATGSCQYTLGVTSFANDSSFSSLSYYKLNGNTLTPLEGNTPYHLGFNVYNIGSTGAHVDAFSYNSGDNAPPTYVGQAVIEGIDWSNLTATDIGSIAITWSLTDYENPENYGDNFMSVNTLGMNTLGVDTAHVPEPSQVAASILLITGLIMIAAVRRRVTSQASAKNLPLF